MICYRDKTFCPFWHDCANASQCGRALTDDVVERAREWWGGENAPIATFGSMPGCHARLEDAAALNYEGNG